jgi:hypothetical protein
VLARAACKVSAEAAVNDGDPVYVRFVATGGEVRGAMRARPRLHRLRAPPGARWDTSTTRRRRHRRRRSQPPELSEHMKRRITLDQRIARINAVMGRIGVVWTRTRR